MGKISNRLVLGFGTLILLLSVEIVLTQIISRQAKVTYEKLKTEIGPAMTMLSQYRTANMELLLLSSNKVIGKTDETYTNRMKAITEVELPHFKTEVELLKQSLLRTDAKAQISDNIIGLTNSAIGIVKDINILLLTTKDYSDSQKMDLAAKKVNNELSEIASKLDNDIALLQMEFGTYFNANQSKLSQSLHDMSNFIFFIGLTGIIFGLTIAFRTIRLIVRPIKTLQSSARRISSGDYDFTIPVKGKDELASLGNSFNQMSESLQKNFDEINSKNKELERFVYIASHDLQEPLQTIRSFTELFEQEYQGKLDNDANTYLNFISEAAKRMSNLIKGLLDYSRIGRAKKLSKIDCNDLVKGVQDDLSILITKTNARVSVGNLPQIVGYTTELRLLFQNLISNAIKFSKPNIYPHVTIDAERNGDYWKFSVQDNGIGIADKFKQQIFTIFLRLHNKSEYEGTGIGLAHCNKIIEMHEGKIWVDSLPDEGSTFYFTIKNKRL